MSKNKTNYYYKGKRYKMMKEKLESEYGQELVIKIFDKANENLNKLYKKYENVSKDEKFHLYNSILPRIAMYQILSEELNSDKAMKITEETVKDVCTKIGNILGEMTSLPGMSSLFLQIFRIKVKKKFGDTSGFTQKFYNTEDGSLRFDTQKCPYCKYSKECGCPEIIHTFCDSDIYCYGNLPKIKFSRTQTLGTGGECCDFHLKKVKKKNNK